MRPDHTLPSRWFLLMLILTTAVSARAMDSAAQQAVIADFATKTYRCDATYDDSGNLVTVLLSNHGMERKQQPEKPGIGDDDFLKLAGLTSLREITVIHQAITERGFAVLSTLPQLTKFWEEYVPEGTDPEFVTSLAACPHLKTLAIKHNFALANAVSPMASLPSFPELETLVLDMNSATSEAVDLVIRCPAIRHLELHRTTMTGEDLSRIIAGLPQVEELWIKPKSSGKGITHSDLKRLQASSSLRMVALHQKGALPLPFTDGLDALAAMPALNEVNFGGTGLSAHDPAIAALTAARPDLLFSGLAEEK